MTSRSLYVAVLVIALIGCGKSNLTVTTHGSSQGIAKTSVDVYRNNAVYASYTGEQVWYRAGVPSGSYFVKTLYDGQTYTSPTLSVNPKAFQTFEAKFDIYLPGLSSSGSFGEITATDGR